MAEQDEEFTIYVGATTLDEYLSRPPEDEIDDVPSFVWPLWLMRRAQDAPTGVPEVRVDDEAR